MTIVALNSKDKKEVMFLFRSVTQHLQQQGIHQWDRYYPNRFVIASDLKKNNLFGIKIDEQVVAVVVLDTKQSSKYTALKWSDRQGEHACIHRLAVHPNYQGRGLGKRLLRFAESLAVEQGKSSIRLDVYTRNASALGMYSRAGYEQRGEVLFPFRKMPYMCFEKLL